MWWDENNCSKMASQMSNQLYGCMSTVNQPMLKRSMLLEEILLLGDKQARRD